MVLYDGSGNSFLGSLELAFRAGVRWGRGTRCLGIIHRATQVLYRAEDYKYVLASCRNEIPKSVAQDLLVQ